jgi:hypothetical protein
MEAAPRHRACSGFHATKHARTVCSTSGKGSRPSIAVIALNVRCNQEQSYLCELPTGGLADIPTQCSVCVAPPNPIPSRVRLKEPSITTSDSGQRPVIPVLPPLRQALPAVHFGRRG